jgi:outer membrane biosynthesis protein TonB
MICFQGVVQQALAADKASAARYHAQINRIASLAIDSALSKHPARLKDVSMKLRYVIGPDGKVYNVTVVSFKSEAWVEKTAVQALKATTFPPIPKDVRQELRMDYLEEEADVSYNSEASTDTATPTFDKYNLRLHKMLQDQVRPAFATQPRRLEVDYEFYVDAQGRVTNLHAYARPAVLGQRGPSLIASVR